MNPSQQTTKIDASTVFLHVGTQKIGRTHNFLSIPANRFFSFSGQHEVEETIDPRWTRFSRLPKSHMMDESARSTGVFEHLERAERLRTWLLESGRHERFHSFNCTPRTLRPNLRNPLNTHRLPQPTTGTNASTVLATLRPSLATLSGRRNLVILRRLLAPPSVWFDADLVTWPEWSTRAGNLVLVVVSAACHIGALRFRGGMWAATAFGRNLAERWASCDPLSDTIESWNEVIAADFVRATHWAWDTLLDESYRSLFHKLMKPALGWAHDELPLPDKIPTSNQRLERYLRWHALTCVASAAALGAIWFTGACWEPQMVGTYLSCHPESPLRRL